MKKVCNDHDYCYVEILNDKDKILKYNHEEKSLKAPLMIYADLLKVFTRENAFLSKQSWKILHREKIKHTPSDYSLFRNC